MGFDLWTYPVRLDSPSVRGIRVDAATWVTAFGFPPFCSAFGDPVPEVSLRLQAELPPDVEGWSYPDRSYQQAEYLLDPDGYRRLTSWEDRERSMPYRIIEGDEEFAAHAVGVQGVRWRCSTAGFLARAVGVIDALDPAGARAEFSVAEMAELGVYKVDPSADDDEEFAFLLGRLRQLAAYYRRLVSHGVDLIVEKD
jgi:hypothetical protein